MAAQEGFELAVEPDHLLIHMTLRGFWTLETGKAFERAPADVIDRTGWAGRYLGLIDKRDFPTQSNDIATFFSEMGANPNLDARRMAIITGSVLQRMQTQRITDGHDREMFATVEEGRRWLLDSAR